MSKGRKRKYSFERRTSWKIVITNLVIIAMCAFMFGYIYKLRHSVENQRVNIDAQKQSMILTNQFTQAVLDAQNTANFIAFSGQSRYVVHFNELCNQIDSVAEALFLTGLNEGNCQRIVEINALLNQKAQVSLALSKQFYDFNPLADLDRAIDEYEPPQQIEQAVVTTTTHDTIVHQGRKRNFWQRLGDVFRPDQDDSIVQVSAQRIDTLINERPYDSSSILSDLRSMSDQAKQEYRSKIKEYESKTSQLISDDSQLSERIATMLLDLNEEILDSAMAEIRNSEALIEANTRTSTLIAAITLLLIVVFVILIISDINKGFRARRAAEEAQKKTEEIMESRHKLLLSVTHDIKTPLTSIIGNVELLDKTANEKEIASIHQSTDHILSLLNNLLEFSSLEQGKLQASPSPFNIKQLCDELHDMFEPLAKQRDLQFNYNADLAPDLVIVSDALKIRQIVSNLVSNSIKYTLEGSVDFSATMDGQQLVIDVSDTGVGIPADKVEEVFKPFARIEANSKFAEGSGYGLSVVKGLVELLGGHIDLSTEVGQGSHFTVTLPVAVQTATETTASPVSPRNILVIDDDDTLLTVVGNMLQRLGHTAIPCRSKNDFEAAMSQIDGYDSILTDYEMGAVKGADVLRRLQATAPTIPVVLMTARTEYDTAKAQGEGFADFLRKPFGMGELEAVFGNASNGDKEESASPFSPLFPSFCAMMGNDADAISQILNVFAQSTSDDLMAMNNAIEANDFVGAQALCHKMLPMFTQLEQDTTFLAKMNAMRGNDAAAQAYPTWTDDAIRFMAQADALIESIDEVM